MPDRDLVIDLENARVTPFRMRPLDGWHAEPITEINHFYVIGPSKHAYYVKLTAPARHRNMWGHLWETMECVRGGPIRADESIYVAVAVEDYIRATETWKYHPHYVDWPVRDGSKTDD